MIRPEAAKECDRARYAAKREEILDQQRAYRESHPATEAQRARKAALQRERRARALQATPEEVAERRAKQRIISARYQAAHREEINAARRARRHRPLPTTKAKPVGISINGTGKVQKWLTPERLHQAVVDLSTWAETHPFREPL